MKRIILICTEQYYGYKKIIQDTYNDIEAYGGYDIEKGISEISKINPGAVIFLNYYKPQEYESGLVIEHIRKIRSVTNNQIIILTSEKPSTEFILQADEYSVEVIWGKEIDFDIDNIPETELPSNGEDELDKVQNEDGGVRTDEDNDASISQFNDRKIIACVDDFLDLITIPYFLVDKLEAISTSINETYFQNQVIRQLNFSFLIMIML